MYHERVARRKPSLYHEFMRRWSPILLLPWLAAPLAMVLVRRVLGGLAGRELNQILKRSGQLLLVFGVLLAAGLLLATGR